MAYAGVDRRSGTLTAAVTDRGLVQAGVRGEELDGVLQELADRSVAARARGAGPAGRRAPRAGRVLRGAPARRSRLPVDWQLSHGFRLKAREACYAIPFGRALTYAELAGGRAARGPSRAAGQAMASKPDADRRALPPRASHRRRRWAATAAGSTSSAGCSTSSAASGSRQPRDRPASSATAPWCRTCRGHARARRTTARPHEEPAGPGGQPRGRVTQALELELEPVMGDPEPLRHPGLELGVRAERWPTWVKSVRPGFSVRAHSTPSVIGMWSLHRPVAGRGVQHEQIGARGPASSPAAGEIGRVDERSPPGPV